jgi:hypothetical protein
MRQGIGWILCGLLMISGTALATPGGIPEGQVSEVLNRLQVGRPLQYQGLTIFPLTLKGSDSRPYVTMDRAVERGWVVFSELDRAEVNTVLVENRSAQYVFLLAGEMISGAKQDRMVGQDILLPPKSGPIKVEVFCVEHGRWVAQSDHFGSARANAPLAVRKAGAIDQDQSMVWDRVAEKRAENSVTAGSGGSYLEVPKAPEVQSKMKPYKDALLALPRTVPEGSGVAVAVGDQILCLDLFVSKGLFQDLYPKLLDSYVTDAMNKPKTWRGVTQKDVEDLLAHARNADEHEVPTPGAGWAEELKGSRVSGTALFDKGSLVHLDLFPKEPAYRENPLPRGATPNLDFRREQNR